MEFHCGLLLESASSGHYRKNTLNYSTVTPELNSCVCDMKRLWEAMLQHFSTDFFSQGELKFLSNANIMSTLSGGSLI